MNYSWEKLFSKQILKRGKEYYMQKRVLRPRKDIRENIYTAYVSGSEMYSVEIQMGKNSIRNMRCQCPYAKDGHRCKHMAAVLYALQAEGKLLTQEPAEQAVVTAPARKRPKVRVYPFRTPAEKKNVYQYYNLDRLTREIKIYEEELEEARKVIQENRAKLTNLEDGYRNYAYIGMERICRVDGKAKSPKGTPYRLQIEFSREKFMAASCSCSECRQKNGTARHYSGSIEQLCVHTLALMLLLHDYMQETLIGDATDLNGGALITDFRTRRKADRMEQLLAKSDMPTVHLEPRLNVETDGSMDLSFRIGQQKLYVVKNLPDLVETVEARGEMPLGTKNSVSFAAAEFDEDSKGLYRFIKREVKTENLRDEQHSDHYYRYSANTAEGMGSSLPLYGRRLDDFFTLMDGKTVSFVQKTERDKKTGEAGVCTNNPRVKLQLEKTLSPEGIFDGLMVTGIMPDLVDGIDYKYFFDGKNLNRADAEKLDLLDMLREHEYSNQIRFIIGRKHITEFYHRILPMLREFAEIKEMEGEELQTFVAPEPAFTFYLDAADGNVTCDASVAYGEKTQQLTALDEWGVSVELHRVASEFRDLQLETEVRQKLETIFPYSDENGLLHCGEEEVLIYDVLEHGVDQLLEMGEVQATDRFRRMTIRRKPQLTVGVKVESGLLNLQISSADLTEDELLEFLSAYRKKKKYHRLKNGDFLRMDEEGLEELAELMEDMKLSPADFVKGKAHLPAYRSLYLDKLLEKNDVLYAKRDVAFRNLVKEFKTVDESEFEVPESLRGIMRGYQEFGYKWLRTMERYQFGGILADDMGLGKTLQVISVLLAAKEEGRLHGENGSGALVVTPASLVYNWKEEFAKFTPQLKVSIVTGGKDDRQQLLGETSDADVLITSYDLLKRDISFYENRNFRYQIIDEAQYIKTHTTAAAKAVKAVQSQIRFALTGTPIENRLSELWSIFDYLMPGFLYGYDRFRKEMETPIVKNGDEDIMKRLRRMVEPFILRRLKQDVLHDLPEKTEEVYFVNFEGTQQKLYDGQAVRMKQMLQGQSEEAFQKNKIAILAEITKIRQICCDPSLCFDDYKGESAKRDTCMELVKSAIEGEHKVLLFSQFTSLLELLERDLTAEGISYYKITGQTKKEERLELVKKFNQDTTPVFLVSLKAGGTGLNLTGADIVIHFDPWWNVAAQNQATDRAHRIGQTRPVTVYKLIAKNSIEEKILHLQEHKQKLADEILSGGSGGIMSMSRDELLALL